VSEFFVCCCMTLRARCLPVCSSYSYLCLHAIPPSLIALLPTQVIRLSLESGVMSRQTSLVLVSDEPGRNDGRVPSRVDVPATVPADYGGHPYFQAGGNNAILTLSAPAPSIQSGLNLGSSHMSKLASGSLSLTPLPEQTDEASLGFVDPPAPEQQVGEESLATSPQRLAPPLSDGVPSLLVRASLVFAAVAALCGAGVALWRLGRWVRSRRSKAE